MSEIHDFDNTVIAILNPVPAVREASADLRSAGYEVEVLSGESGQEHLDPAGESGVRATLKRLMGAFGDQYRITERLDRELADGRIVISVETKPDDAEHAVRILRDHGGHYIWKLGAWTFTAIDE
jgi:hypothetical protein